MTSLAGELEESRATLTAVSGTPDEEDIAADTTAALRLRLRRLLEQHPDTADELRLLIEEFKTRDGDQGAVHNAITGGTQHGPVFQGRSFSRLTFGGSGTPPPDQ